MVRQLIADAKWSAVLAFGLTGLVVGCSSSGGGSDAKPAAPTTPIGTPKPAFEGKAPKGAFVVKGAIGRYSKRLVIAQGGGPKSFNPIVSNEGSTNDILKGPLFQTCWDFNRDTQEEEPALCEKYVRSADGLKYTFTVREGIRWSDGEPITADDFIFSYGLVIDPKVPNAGKDLFRQGKDADGKALFPTIAKESDRVFSFTLHEPDVLFHMNVGSIYVVPKHRWADAAKAGRFDTVMGLAMKPKDLVTSGPFVLHSYRPDEAVILRRNPNYWKVDTDGNRLPYLDKVFFLVVPDFNSEFLRFREGETDLLEIRPEHYDPLKRGERDGNYVVKDLGPALTTTYLMFNQDPRNKADGTPRVDPIKLKWFTDKNFRKGISHAIDRDGIARTVLNGRGEPLWSFYSPANKRWAYDGVVKYPLDRPKARQLLASSGFEQRDGALIDAQGNPVAFTVLTNAENANRVGMLNVIKNDLSKLGVKMTIRPVPFNDLVQKLRGTRDFDAILLGWGSAVPPDPAQSKNVMLSSGRSHYWHAEQATPSTPWEKRMDELVFENTRAADFATRKKASDALLRIFSDEQPQIQLVVEHAFAAARKDIGNFRPTAFKPKAHWNLEQLFLKTPRKGSR